MGFLCVGFVNKYDIMIYNLIVIERYLSKFKSYCFQVFFSKIYLFYKIFDINATLFDNYRYYFFFNFILFGDLINIELSWSKKCDHAGPLVNICLIGFHIDFQIYDNRHWDDKNDRWEIYSNEEGKS